MYHLIMVSARMICPTDRSNVSHSRRTSASIFSYPRRSSSLVTDPGQVNAKSKLSQLAMPGRSVLSR